MGDNIVTVENTIITATGNYLNPVVKMQHRRTGKYIKLRRALQNLV